MCDGLKDRAPRQCEKGNGSELPVSRNWPGTLGLRLNSRLTWRLMHVTGPPHSSSSSSDNRAENIARLTWNDVTVTEELATIQLGTIQIALPDALAQPWRELAANLGHDLTASHPNTKWIFRGASPGRHIHPGHLTTRLSKLFSTRAARLGTLHELIKLAPVAIIAETLGYSPTTVERHATDSAAAYAQYIAAVRGG